MKVKFRAWDKVNKRFDYWDAQPVKIVDDDVHLYNHGMQLLHRAHGLAWSKEESDAEDARMGQADYEEPELISGLKDRQNVPIYAGDILSHTDNPEIWLMVVYYEFGAFRVKDAKNRIGGQYVGVTELLYDHVSDPLLPGEEPESEGWEVVGNIYETPELTKKGEA